MGLGLLIMLDLSLSYIFLLNDFFSLVFFEAFNALEPQLVAEEIICPVILLVAFQVLGRDWPHLLTFLTLHNDRPLSVYWLARLDRFCIK